jgi:hypothetical protein
MDNRDDATPDESDRPRGLERAVAILAELADAFGAALVASAEEQRIAAAGRVAAVATALRCAARSLDQSESPGIAEGAGRAADRIDGLAHFVQERSWREIAAETAAFARRRPGLFGLGAVSLGFLASRLLLLPVDRDGPDERTPAAEGGGETANRADGGRPNRQAP